MLAIDQPDVIRPDEAIDLPRLSSYLKSKIAELSDVSGELEIFRYNSGHANLTYMIKFGNQEFVLKREPPGTKAKSAHDMGREFHMLSKLHPWYSLAPKAFLYSDDASIMGGAFCVMEKRKGVIIRRQYPEDADIGLGQIGQQFKALIESLAELHKLDIAAVGLGDFGRPEGYRQRQVEGWQKRLRNAATPDMADFSVVTPWLTDHLPKEAQAATVVHNDFKLDNLVWDPADISRLVGVLDWEMSTVGDPLMDLACTLSFWVEEGDPQEFRSIRAMPSARPDVLSRREAAAYYTERTGRNVAFLDFLLCFGFFRRAAIEQQKYHRFSTGQTKDARFSHLNHAVTVLRDMCLSVIGGNL
jgi:aminoglycoside phosphotransferase (APT) family kinase protein